MADFCRQCTINMEGIEYADKNDLRGLSTSEDTKKGLFAPVLCEGCGPTQVDHTGLCIHHDEPDHNDFFRKRK